MRIIAYSICIVVSIGLIVGCSSIQPPPPAKILDASTHSSTACQKADSMWNDKIIPSLYADLPVLTAPGVLDLIALARTSFTIRSLTNDSDELDGEPRLVSVSYPASRHVAIPESMKVVPTVSSAGCRWRPNLLKRLPYQHWH